MANPLPDELFFCGGHCQPIHELNLHIPYPQFCQFSALPVLLDSLLQNFTQVLLQPSSMHS